MRPKAPIRPIVVMGGLHPAVKGFYNGCNVKPSAAIVTDLQAFVATLARAGIWQKMGFWYFCAMPDEQQSRINLVNPRGPLAVAVNSPTFTANRGWTGDAVSKYLDTQIPHNATPNFFQNSAHLGAFCSSARAIGLSGANNANVQCNTTRNTLCNAAAALTTTGEVNGGHVIAVRRDAATQYSYRNGGVELSGSSASVALTASTFTMLRLNTTYSNSQISACHAGAGLSAAEASAIIAACRTFLTARGVP